MQSIIAHVVPFAHTLTLRPGGEIFYKFRVLPESNSQGAAVSRVVKSAYERKDLAGLPLSDAVAALLGSNAKFHPPLNSPSMKDKNGFGIMGQRCPKFTKHAKNTIRWGASAIEFAFGLNRCVFLTGTLPGSTLDSQLVFAANSSWFIDRINKWLLKHFSINGEVFRLSVWELQKRGALHLHAVVAVPAGATQSLIDSFQAYWIHLLESLSDSTGTDLFARAAGGSHRGNYLERVKKNGKRGALKDVMCYGAVVTKSVSGYLSKYLSKSAGDYKYGVQPSFYPARWWSVSRAVKTLIASQTVSISIPRFSEYEKNDVLDLVVKHFSLQEKWGETHASLPVFAEDSTRDNPLFEGFKEIHIGYVCWVEPSAGAALVAALGADINALLALTAAETQTIRLQHIIDKQNLASVRMAELSIEAGYSAIERQATKVESSIAIHALREFFASQNNLALSQD